jgi:hypothetical protein
VFRDEERRYLAGTLRSLSLACLRLADRFASIAPLARIFRERFEALSSAISELELAQEDEGSEALLDRFSRLRSLCFDLDIPYSEAIAYANDLRLSEEAAENPASAAPPTDWIEILDDTIRALEAYQRGGGRAWSRPLALRGSEPARRRFREDVVRRTEATRYGNERLLAEARGREFSTVSFRSPGQLVHDPEEARRIAEETPDRFRGLISGPAVATGPVASGDPGDDVAHAIENEERADEPGAIVAGPAVELRAEGDGEEDVESEAPREEEEDVAESRRRSRLVVAAERCSVPIENALDTVRLLAALPEWDRQRAFEAVTRSLDRSRNSLAARRELSRIDPGYTGSDFWGRSEPIDPEGEEPAEPRSGVEMLGDQIRALREDYQSRRTARDEAGAELPPPLDEPNPKLSKYRPR